MKHEADISTRSARPPAADDFARAKAMYAAGEGVDHIVVGQWLRTWGSSGFKDFPNWLADQPG